MFDVATTCPYTGLRSFNEDESLYFEGREKQITEITKLLEKNRFLMVTGASGDGKSSVVFAGIIPNARAGFFKARFPNWVVADFRPEKSPLENFSKSISKALNIPNVTTAETEIRRGFSSLVDLYKSSPLYVDQSSEEWKNSDDAAQKEMTKRGSNLMILVDQFEEFFTTQENFLHGVPSQESQITLNVILETAKIALKEDIPIYIICTMRSDYIGQCSAFRGLPEFIGFSQFFVPRLKRNQLQRVIEEPANLSGNSISRRLVERLIYDLSEGVDQLPILQHALNQIWRAADEGKEEMDLFHYAKVGGMPSDELPDGDQERFNEWYKNLPEYQKKSYSDTSLDNVLDIHANRLYESAAEVYNSKYSEDPITTGDAKRAIGLTFACLTRLDEGRGVRNRMTLQDIANIINNPEINAQKLGRLLNIFRQEGNTFIRPFISTDQDLDLDPGTSLDITHESLLRNWKRLKKWAQKEFEYYETFLDFKKQLDRWIENKESGSFLLPVGPLGFFEDWYENCKPNAHWINRYEDSIDDPSEKLQHSKNILEKTQLFLKKSAQKHFIAKAFMKYGPRNIAMGLAILSTLILSSFYYTDALKKQNKSVIENIYKISEAHINNNEKYAGFTNLKQVWLASGLMNDPEKTLKIINNLDSEESKLDIPIRLYEMIMQSFPNFYGWEKDSTISIIQKNILECVDVPSISDQKKLQEFNQVAFLLAYDDTHNQSENLENLLHEQTSIIHQLLVKVLTAEPSDEFGMPNEIFRGVQMINNYSKTSKQMLTELLPLLSPFTDTGLQNFEHYFPLSGNLENGESPLSHYGGYQMLAEMYASLGDETNLFKSFNFILKTNNPGSYLNVESFMGPYQIYGYLLKNEHLPLCKKFIEFFEVNYQFPKIESYKGFLDKAGYSKHYDYSNFSTADFNNHPGNNNPGMSYLTPQTMDRFFKMAFEAAREIQNPDERNYHLAFFTKSQALITNEYYRERNLDPPLVEIDELLRESFQTHDKISPAYLQTEIPLIHHYYSDGIRRTNQKVQTHLLYPDLYSGGYQGDRYLGGNFINFLIRNPSYLSYYTSEESLNLIIDWIYHGHEYYLYLNDFNRVEDEITLEHLEFLEKILIEASPEKDVDMNFLYLVLSNHYFDQNDVEKALLSIENLNPEEFSTSSTRMEYLNISSFWNQVVLLAENLAKSGEKQKVDEFIATIKEVHFRMKAYFKIARKVHNSDFPENTYYFIEKGYNALSQFDPGPLNNTDSYTQTIIQTLTELGSRELDKLADQELAKFYPDGANEKVLGKIRRGKYFQAMEAIPESNTIPEDLLYYATILFLDAEKKKDPRFKEMTDRMNRYGIIDFGTTSNEYIEFARN